MTDPLDLAAIEARARGSIIRGVGQWPPIGATPEETLALIARVRELEAERCEAALASGVGKTILGEVAASKQAQDATEAICRLGESLVRAEKRAALGARMAWCLKQRAGGLTCEELAALAEWDALTDSKKEAKHD